MLDYFRYRHTLSIRNTYCFSTVTILHERASVLRYGVHYSPISRCKRLEIKKKENQFIQIKAKNFVSVTVVDVTICFKIADILNSEGCRMNT